MILTEQEISEILSFPWEKTVDFVRRVEARIEEKLKAQEPDAWQIRNGLCHAGIRGNQLAAELTAANMQKCHDLGGSLAAFNVRPLYAHPLPPDDVVQKYEELLYAVQRKFPDETRHQTALRYIKTAESPSYTNAAMKEMK